MRKQKKKKNRKKDGKGKREEGRALQEAIQNKGGKPVSRKAASSWRKSGFTTRNEDDVRAGSRKEMISIQGQRKRWPEGNKANDSKSAAEAKRGWRGPSLPIQEPVCAEASMQ
ncbi:kinesin-ii 85 kda subunit [Stemphylium lycopersici]|nr:kinesin-ii 85 kda subunit [Stemphylium lycopersici]